MLTENSPATSSNPVFGLTSTTEISDRSTRDDAGYSQHQHYKDLAELIRDIRDPIVCASGIWGNCLIMLIMLRLPSSTYSVFFKTLALSDQLMLIAGPLDRLFYSKLLVKSFSMGNWCQCKMYMITHRAVTTVSSWMLVALTLLRAASVLWPRRVRAVWTKEKSRVTAGIVIILIIAINWHLLYKCGRIRGVCRLKGSIMYLFGFRVFQIYFLPFVILITSNSVLLWSLVRCVKTRRRPTGQQTSQDVRELRVTSWTVTLIVDSACFVLLTTPFAITMIYGHDYSDREHPANKSVLHAVSYFLFYSKSAVNFFLYCLTNSKFRAELIQTVQEFYGLCHVTKKSTS